MATNDLRELGRRLRIRAKYVTKNSDELTRQAALAVVESLVWSTPVRTGRARTNWQTLLYKTGSVLYPEPMKPASPEYGAQRALQEARETCGIYTGGRRSIWITNNVPYLAKLNAGGSPQQPVPGYIERAIAAGKAKIRVMKPILVEE